MTLSEYIAKVNSLLSPPLAGAELRWAYHCWNSDINPSKLAGWLALTASSPLLPLGLPAAEKEKPPPGP